MIAFDTQDLLVSCARGTNESGAVYVQPELKKKVSSILMPGLGSPSQSSFRDFTVGTVHEYPERIDVVIGTRGGLSAPSP